MADARKPDPRAEVVVDEASSDATTPAIAPAPTLLDSLLDERGEWSRQTRAGYRVEVREEGGTEGIRLVAPSGHLCLKITLEPSGPRIDVYGTELHAHAEDVVRIEGQRVEIAGKESVSVRSEGAVRSDAFEHHIESTHGEVRLVANDDVALDGERIRLNSPPQVRPPHLRKPRPRTPPPGSEDEP